MQGFIGINHDRNKDSAVVGTKEFYVPGFADLGAYRLEKAQLDADWDRFVEASPQGSIYCKQDFIKPLHAKFGAWYCFKNNLLRAAVLLSESEDGRSAPLHELTIYNGLMLAPRSSQQNRAQSQSEEFRTTAAIVRDLSRLYPEGLTMQTHPSFEDIRPFLWHNYGAEGPHFSASVRYTSYLSLPELVEQQDLMATPVYQQANKSRRQEIRYSKQKEEFVEDRFDLDLFKATYIKTFARQGLKVPEEMLTELSDLMVHLDQMGLLRMFVASTRDGGPASIAVFSHDTKRAYYLYGANDPDQRDTHTGTAVLWEALNSLAKAGIREVDLEGVNSPKRGYFKLSFGGEMKTYFHLTLS